MPVRQGEVTVRSAAPTKLEQRLQDLRLVVLRSMEESVIDFYRRVSPQNGRRETEKDLWAQFAYILLSKPKQMIPALIGKLGSPAARTLTRRLIGTWDAYRVSTIRQDSGKKEPCCFPGCPGITLRRLRRSHPKRGIPDVLLLLNPDYSRGKQVAADLFLYFELKCSDRSSFKSQLDRYLAAISAEIPSTGFLGAIGGRRPKLDHSRWLGHLSLADFFALSEKVARSAPDAKPTLAGEIRALHKKLEVREKRREEARLFRRTLRRAALC